MGNPDIHAKKRKGQGDGLSKNCGVVINLVLFSFDGIGQRGNLKKQYFHV